MAQKHSTVRNGKRLVWHTEKLWALSARLAPFEIEIAAIGERALRQLPPQAWISRLPKGSTSAR